jgi:hypothetical protein
VSPADVLLAGVAVACEHARMPRATSVREAAFRQFASYDRNVWEDRKGVLPDFSDVYVERPGPEGAGGRHQDPISQQMRDALIETDGAEKVLLTGQMGSGKSMELRRLYEATDVRERFECLKVVLTERLNMASAIDIRYVLLALASALTEYVYTWQCDDLKGRGLPEGEFKPVLDWVEPLRKLSGVQDPAGDAPWTVKLNLHLVEVTRQLKTDEPIRSAVLQDPAFAPSRLERLLSGLVDLIKRSTRRDLLLLVDDGDKMTKEESARGVFIDNLPALLSLTCPAVITFPYWLHFDDAFQRSIRLCPVYPIANIKVVHRDAPDTLLPEARAFFRGIYGRLVDPRVKLIDDDALETAALRSAGIVREFLRILQRGFRFAHMYKDDFVTNATLAEALLELEREMYYATQLETTRRRLTTVRLQKKLDDEEDRQLLDSLLVVELSNNRPWYDVHPLLQSYVDGLIKEAKERLAREDEKLKEPALTERLLQGLKGA